MKWAFIAGKILLKTFFFIWKLLQSIRFFCLFTVIPILILLAVIANHITTSSIRKPTSTLFHLFDDACCIAATAAQSRTVIGAETLTALRDRTERRRLLEIEQLFEAGILQGFTNTTNAGKVSSIEACYRNQALATLSVCCTTWCLREG